MQFFRLHVRRLTGFALLAMLLIVSQPTMARVRMALAGDSSMAIMGEVCSAETMKLVGIDDAVVQASIARAVAEHVFDHCNYCHLQVLAISPSLPATLGDGVIRLHEAPRLFLRGPRTLAAWLHAHSRGPPVDS